MTETHISLVFKVETILKIYGYCIAFLPGSHALCAGTFDFESKLMCVVEMPFHTKTCFGQITGMSSRVAAVPLDDWPLRNKVLTIGLMGKLSGSS